MRRLSFWYYVEVTVVILARGGADHGEAWFLRGDMPRFGTSMSCWRQFDSTRYFNTFMQ